MSKIRVWLRAVLGFSRTESNAFMVLVPILIIILLSEPVASYYISSHPYDITADVKRLDSLSAHWVYADTDEIFEEEPQTVEKVVKELFRFNPNSASDNELKSLGFSKKQRSSLIHYREKGGVLRTKKDLKKIYGMDSILFHSLEAFIELPEKIEYQKYTNTLKPKPVELAFDLNTADTLQLKSIYGIGSKLSIRIIKYRDQLGGFVNADQLKEVYGLDTTVIRQLWKKSFLLENFIPEKININEITGKEERRVHPYIDKKLATAIASYRFQHGTFKQVDDLRKIHFVTKDVADKIIPYLRVE